MRLEPRERIVNFDPVLEGGVGGRTKVQVSNMCFGACMGESGMDGGCRGGVLAVLLFGCWLLVVWLLGFSLKTVVSQHLITNHQTVIPLAIH